MQAFASKAFSESELRPMPINPHLTAGIPGSGHCGSLPGLAHTRRWSFTDYSGVEERGHLALKWRCMHHAFMSSPSGAFVLVASAIALAGITSITTAAVIVHVGAAAFKWSAVES